MIARLSRLMFLAALLLMSSIPGAAAAGELRIVDSRGLIMAMKKVSAPADVVLSFREGQTPAEAPVLSSVEGLTDDIKGIPEGPSRFIFRKVADGAWRIEANREPSAIAEVIILNR